MNCCMCSKCYEPKNMLIPRRCLVTHGFTSHRICQVCWFTCFALENGDHRCPGCLNGLPLNCIPCAKADVKKRNNY